MVISYMNWSFLFFTNSLLFGIGLAMDAFSVSLVRGLLEPKMTGRRMALIAGTFGLFQTGMPLLGWLFVHLLVERFTVLEKITPWAALVLLLYIGGEIVNGVTLRDNVSQITHVIGGLCGAVLGLTMRSRR